MVIKKTNKILIPEDITLKEPTTLEDSGSDVQNLIKMADFQSELRKCRNLDEIFDLLNSLQSSNVTAGLAVFALSCLADLQRNPDDSNEKPSHKLQKTIQMFTSSAVLEKLFDVVCKGQTIHILEALDAIMRGYLIFHYEPMFFEKLCNEFLLRLNEGNVHVSQIYEFAVLLLGIRGDHSTIMDQLWVGITDKSADINSGNLLLMYRLLPLLKCSRNVVFRVLEKRTYALWQELRIQDIDEILYILVKVNRPQAKLLTSLTKWINLNIHTIDEKQLTKIVEHFTVLNHIDANITSAVERLIKVKNKNIVEAKLVAQVMHFCLHFRLKSPIILENIANYFTTHASNLSSDHIVNIVKPYGMLNYIPQNPYDFYSKLEEVLEAKFTQFRPEDIVELLLTCTFVQRFPLNFVKRIFSQHFLDRLSTIQNSNELQKAYNHLRLLDAAMTLECRHYRGPLLSCNFPMLNIYRDGRLLKAVSKLNGPLAELLNGRENFATDYRLTKPLSEMYTTDIALHMNKEGQPIPFTERARIGKKVAILIFLPEHYCYNSRDLIGPQISRIRHLQKLGYSVRHLDCNEVFSFSKSELIDQLKHKIFLSDS